MITQATFDSDLDQYPTLMPDIDEEVFLQLLIGAPKTKVFIPINYSWSNYLEDSYFRVYHERRELAPKLRRNPYGRLLREQRCPNLLFTLATDDGYFANSVIAELSLLIQSDNINTLVLGDLPGTGVILSTNYLQRDKLVILENPDVWN